MGKIALMTDSASDVSCEFIRKYSVKVIPLRIYFSERTFRDRVDIVPPQIYDMLKEEIPKTSLPTAEDILKVFELIKQEGYEKVLYLGISSGLSGTYGFVKTLGEEYFGGNFYSFDTKILSSGEGLLVQKAAEMLSSGVNIQSILECLQIIRAKMFSSFIVKDITYLVKGGRIGKVAGTLGSFLKICPIIRVNDDGVYETAGKSIGFSRALQLMLRQVQEKFAGLKVAVEVVHGFEESTADMILSKIKKFSKVVKSAVVPVTAVLGVHTGPGFVGVVAYEI